MSNKENNNDHQPIYNEDGFDISALLDMYNNKGKGQTRGFDFDNSAVDVSQDSEVSRLEAEYLESRRMRRLEEDRREAPRENVQRRTAPPAPKKKSNRKKKLFGIIAFVAIICVVVVAIGGTIGSVLGKINYNDKIENQYVSSSELKSENGIINVLFLGVDARAYKGEEAETSRSDSMMLVSVDTKHQCIKTISFLRDSWVYIPCKDMKQRLNSACQYGSYNGVMDTIEYNFGVDIDGYVVVDFNVFQSLVDAIGGVEIDVTEAEAKEVTSHPKRYGKVELEAGKHILDGKQTLAYCRIRKIDTDFQRAYRQRMVIKSIISGVKSNPTKLFSIANNCAEYVETDLSKSELEKIAFNLTKCLKNDMTETRVPFDGTWEYAKIKGNSVIKLDTEKNKEMLIDYIYNKSYDDIVAEEKAE